MIALTALIGVAGVVAAREREPNLAANPSFEQGEGLPDGWERFAPAGSLLTRDDRVARSGRASARMVIDGEGAREYPSFKLRLTEVAAGQEYQGTAWARTEGMTDLGAYLAIEFYRGHQRLSFAQGDLTGPGDHDWTRLAARAMVPEGTDNITFCLVAHGEGRVWFDDARLVRTAKAPPVFTGDRVEVSLRPGRTLNPHFHGFGAQGDYFLTRSINTDRGVGEDDRRLVLARVEAMRPHLIRTFFDYQWWEPEEGRQTPDSEAMQDYLGWVRFLKGIGTSVLLCPWGDYFAYSEWMRDGTSRLPKPGKRDAMVRSLVDLVAFLRRDQGLDNVRYLCLMNEPDNDPTRAVPPEEFVRLYRLLDQLLRERGLRREVFLLGLDECSGGPSEASPWFREITSRGLEYCDGAASHTYKHEYVPGLVPWLRARLDLLQPSRKPLFIAEFGYAGAILDTFKNPENVKYEYGLFLADFAVMALRERASAALMWCMMDTYYDAVHCQEYGLWRYKTAEWEPRPGFYSWSLVNRYTRPGSRVVAVDTTAGAANVRAVALESPEGKWSLLAVNRYDRELTAEVALGLRRAVTLQVYRYDRASAPTVDRGMIPASGEVTLAPREQATVALPAQSFTLLTEVR